MAATSTDAAYSVILDSATPGESDKPARQTVAQYREHLQRLFILDPVSPWMPSFTPLKRLTKTPKHHLVDPALAAVMAGADVDALLGGATSPGPAGTWLGSLFESLVAQSIRVYAGFAEATVGHLRTQNGDHEVDLIVEGPGMTVIAIEVKLAATVVDKDVRHLNWLKSQIGDRAPGWRGSDPPGTGGTVRRRLLRCARRLEAANQTDRITSMFHPLSR